MDRSGRTRERDPVVDLFPHESGIPIVAVDDLDATVMRSAIVHHGAIVVRNLLSSARCASLCDAIDKSWEAIARYQAAGETNPAWFDPIQASGYGADMQSRMWGLKSGTAYVADSPRLFFELIEAFDDIGMKEIVGDYFGEPPCSHSRKQRNVVFLQTPLANGTRTRPSTAPPPTRSTSGSLCRVVAIWLRDSSSGRAALRTCSKR